MPYDPARHHRKTFRLAGYDYRLPGAYLVTICTQNRVCFFGNVVAEEMRRNAAGEMVEQWWVALASKFATVTPYDHIVMPNHIHGVIVLAGTHDDENEQAGSPRQPNNPRIVNTGRRADTSLPLAGVGADPSVCPETPSRRAEEPMENAGGHIGPPLPQVIQWFKTMTTNAYIRGVKSERWPAFAGRLWQRNYYEHIIRNETDLTRFRAYIAANPAQWAVDRENPERVGA